LFNHCYSSSSRSINRWPWTIGCVREFWPWLLLNKSLALGFLFYCRYMPASIARARRLFRPPQAAICKNEIKSGSRNSKKRHPNCSCRKRSSRLLKDMFPSLLSY
jgi:hypothetical protein